MIDDSSMKAGQERKHPTSEEEISLEGGGEKAPPLMQHRPRNRAISERDSAEMDEENDDEQKQEDALVDILA